MIRLNTFWTEPPTHVRVYPCPSCQETISVEAPRCRFCHEPIPVKVAEQRWAENQQLRVEKQHIATAISRADTYMSITRVSILLTAITIWRAFPLGSLAEGWVLFQLLAISYGAQWLNHNSSLVTADADYVEGVAKVKRAMLIWAVLLLTQVLFYLILNGFPEWTSILDLLGLE